MCGYHRRILALSPTAPNADSLSAMERHILLDGIDLSRSLGVEIGALCRPHVRRADGPVIYVDHADTATLRQKYAGDPGVSLDDLVPVDVVWGERPLSESITAADYVVASHVVEHVPDLIGWLAELRAILKPGGRVRLAVPDRRYTFDYLRKETDLLDVEYAHNQRATRPQTHIVYDYVRNAVKLDAAKAWAGGLDASSLERHHSVRHALAIAQAAESGAYHDVHCWVFTPRSFCLLFAKMADHGLIRFACETFHDTAPGTIEFCAGLLASDAPAGDSWRAAAEHCR